MYSAWWTGGGNGSGEQAVNNQILICFVLCKDLITVALSYCELEYT